jgi:hypothetical protein
MQMGLVRDKTDKVDAKLIAQYTELEHLPLWQPTPELLSEAAQEMTQTRCWAIVRSVVEQLIKQRAALPNQQAALDLPILSIGGSLSYLVQAKRHKMY